VALLKHLIIIFFALAGGFMSACSAEPPARDSTLVATIISKEDSMTYRSLTPEERAVIIDKGTERPFTGIYFLNKENGSYHCRQCDALLFRSDDKFESGTGWPSFDDAVPGAVRQVTDADGRRTEIVCANCGGHLGHVFFDEGFTSKNARYCVNSISLTFDPADKPPVHTEKAVFAGGCFWGVEYHFKNVKGVVSTRVGYTGGTTEHPSYRQVCTGDTGHSEAIEVEFDPKVVGYEELAKLFFEIHDPTQFNRQGPDVGTQYRSAVYYRNDEQRKIAEALIAKLLEKGYRVVTEVKQAGEFWPAEEYHQDYYEKTGHHPYCHIYQKRF
jgi:peptide methionine sulfoxide reductase msrA/msrB